MKLRLKEIRKERGLTQRQVADMAGMSQSYYTELENGKKQINAHRMECIAKALRVRPRDLIFDASVSKDADRLERLSQLDEAQMDLVMNMVDQLLSSRR